MVKPVLDRARCQRPLGCCWIKLYHDQSMAQGIRVQVVLPVPTVEALRARAKAEGRTVSAMGAFFIEAGLRAIPDLARPADAP